MQAPSGALDLQVDLTLDSNLASVDRAEEAAVSTATRLGLDEDDQHRVGIAIRESMVNAVAHGNRYSAKKKVHFRIWTGPDRFAIEIEDEGPGFIPAEVPDPREGENVFRQSGRGLLMIRALMDEVVFETRETQGTRVRMVKYLPGKGETDSTS